jgi:hypothetical protein
MDLPGEMGRSAARMVDDTTTYFTVGPNLSETRRGCDTGVRRLVSSAMPETNRAWAR